MLKIKESKYIKQKQKTKNKEKNLREETLAFHWFLHMHVGAVNVCGGFGGLGKQANIYLHT